MRAEAIARALSGRRVGSGFLARCPAHDDQTPSLSIRDGADGRTLVFCHAGCTQRAVISELAARGLWPRRGEDTRATEAARPPNSRAPQASQTMALEIWLRSRSAERSPVIRYLAARGVTLSLPPSLRFHPALRHPDGECWPAMVALVTRGETAEPTAIHRTFLKRDGTGKAPVTPDKMMLGPCRGGAVRLGQHSTSVMIGEGIETCLAAMQAMRRSAWAALSTSGLKKLELPREIDDVVILADGDPAGEDAALAAARRWRDEGRRVRIAQAPEGQDFNDVLLAPSAGAPEGVS